jgi:RNA ligase (TIGR02306 family)
MRKLATIETIAAIKPHPNADRLELATIRDWQVCVEKGTYTAGDQCVYCEIDSIMPQRPEYEFLAVRHYRIKTIKLRGMLSQGIVFPMSVLPIGGSAHDPTHEFHIGDDVTEMLGITLYMPPCSLSLGNDTLSDFPSFIPKTDEERVQNCWPLVKTNKPRLWVGTEKLEGTSMTVYWKNDHFGVCSRNTELRQSNGNAHWDTAIKLNLEFKLKEYGKNIALQGELIGPKIQGNPYKLAEPRWRVFSVYNIDTKQYYGYGTALNILTELRLNPVPLIYPCASLLHFDTIDDLLAASDGPSMINPGTRREGIVWRTVTHDRISFKAVSNAYLLSSKF